MIAALDSDRYHDLLRTLQMLIDAAPQPIPDEVLLRGARRALWRADEKLDRAIAMPEPDRPDHTGTPSPASARDLALHDARKAYKRARYAVEVVAGITGTGSKRLAALQDVLGAHQDAIVAAEVVRVFAEEAFREGDDTFEYGVIHADLRTEADAALESLEKARHRAARGQWRQRLTP